LRTSGTGLPHLPGVATPTEVQRAPAAGFGWLKAFPAAQLGAGWITAMHGPFPEARCVATGGIDLSNAAGFLSA
jgi:2-dehydro-3-deoxyphosphogluconate aldolase/(4S)-4-hydroxy-2-oxoglutarate aldolase